MQIRRILLFLFPLIAVALECEEFVMRIGQRVQHQDFARLTPQEKFFLDYDTTLVPIGPVEACINNPLMRYLTLSRTYAFSMDVVLHEPHGVCLPKECNYEGLNSRQDIARKLFAIKNWVLNPDETVNAYDPSIFDAPPGFYICLCIFAAFFIMSVTATIHIHRRTKLQKRELCDKKELKSGQAIKASYQPHWALKIFDLKPIVINFYQTAEEQKLNSDMAIFSLLRILTSYYIIYYHTIGTYRMGNYSHEENSTPLDTALIGVGDLTVEYFFMMAGFFGAYVLIPKLNKTKLSFKIYFDLFKHRWLRIWPLLFLSFLFYWQVTPYFWNGPLWFWYRHFTPICNQVWWQKLLLIDNLFAEYLAGGSCFRPTWYLPVEFQMYLVGILVVYAYTRNRKLGFALAALLIIQNFGLAIIPDYKYDLWWGMNGARYRKILAGLPYQRWGVFFIGVIWGLLYYEYAKEKKKNIFWIFETKRIVSHFTMFIGLILNLYVYLCHLSGKNIFAGVYLWPEFNSTFLPGFIPGLAPGSHFAIYFWVPVRMFLFAFSMTLIMMPLASKRKFSIKTFLNLRLFQMLGKTSYAVYLFNEPFLFALGLSSNKMHTYSTGGYYVLAIQGILVAQAIGTAMHLMVEKPINNFESYLINRKKKTSNQVMNKNEKLQLSVEVKINKPEDTFINSHRAQNPSPLEIDPQEKSSTIGLTPVTDIAISPDDISRLQTPPQSGESSEKEVLALPVQPEP